MRVVHLILSFKPLSYKFQDMDNVIREGDLRLAQIDVSVSGFLARKGILQVELPFHCSPYEAVVPRKEIASSRLSLEMEINQF